MIADLIRHRSSAPVQWTDKPPDCAKRLAGFFDKLCRAGFDAAPRMATILATYIKAAVLDNVVSAPDENLSKLILNNR
jgi:hypothetical protein